ncbi:uncharacterized protein BXZ73DRAFT_105723 [Epithele typhae]|uniref:uncharacterized protein n=1 Tax=Epithele typhae TaxID=378194 RepID=UPI00200837AA|nr:uncharacterized protein BXZ73DRAFT_105723 [Epithele typhae]KAH9916745.1 hypothetical protein BXZ73DRAFT_105723 [Epithele typhae]
MPVEPRYPDLIDEEVIVILLDLYARDLFKFDTHEYLARMLDRVLKHPPSRKVIFEKHTHIIRHPVILDLLRAMHAPKPKPSTVDASNLRQKPSPPAPASSSSSPHPSPSPPRQPPARPPHLPSVKHTPEYRPAQAVRTIPPPISTRSAPQPQPQPPAHTSHYEAVAQPVARGGQQTVPRASADIMPRIIPYQRRGAPVLRYHPYESSTRAPTQSGSTSAALSDEDERGKWAWRG